MTADQIFDAWHRRICPGSVRDIAVAALSRLEQKLNEDKRAYLEKAETFYMDSQAVDSDSDPDTDANFIQLVTNGIKDSNIRSVVHAKRSKTIDELRDNWRQANADFEIDHRIGDIDTHKISEMSKEQQVSKNQQSQKVFPCYSCHSTSHNIADCPHNKSPISKEIAKQFAKLRVGKKGRGGKNKGGQ